jgi:hypothetical protein
MAQKDAFSYLIVHHTGEVKLSCLSREVQQDSAATKPNESSPNLSMSSYNTSRNEMK